MMTTLLHYFEYPFVRGAFLAGILVALCASLLGVTLVLKRFSMIGDGLSHMAFGAMSVAALLGLSNDYWVTLPLTVLAAIILLKSGKNSRIHGDAAVAMISVGALAIGYLFMNMTEGNANVSGDVCTTLFGSTSIMTLTSVDLWVCVALSITVILIFVFLKNRIFAVTFDETFARATGMKTDLYNTLLAVVTALIIVSAMKLVGALLISALIIFPPLSAMGLFKSFKSVLIASAVFGIFCAAVGLVLSLLFALPVGATIVVVNIAMFLLTRGAGNFIKK